MEPAVPPHFIQMFQSVTTAGMDSSMSPAQRVETCVAQLMSTKVFPTRKPAACSSSSSSSSSSSASKPFALPALQPCDLSHIDPEFKKAESFTAYLNEYAEKVAAMSVLFEGCANFQNTVIGCICLPWLVYEYNKHHGSFNPWGDDDDDDGQYDGPSPIDQEQDGIVDPLTVSSSSSSSSSSSAAAAVTAGGAASGKGGRGSGGGKNRVTGKKHKKKRKRAMPAVYHPIDPDNIPIPPCWVSGCQLFFVKPLFAVCAAVWWKKYKLKDFDKYLEEMANKTTTNLRTGKFYHCRSIPEEWSSVFIGCHPPLTFFKQLNRISPNHTFPVPETRLHERQWKPTQKPEGVSCGCGVLADGGCPPEHFQTPSQMPSKLKRLVNDAAIPIHGGGRYRRATMAAASVSAPVAAPAPHPLPPPPPVPTVPDPVIHMKNSFSAQIMRRIRRQLQEDGDSEDEAGEDHDDEDETEGRLLMENDPHALAWENYAAVIDIGSVYVCDKDVKTMMRNRPLTSSMEDVDCYINENILC